MRANLSARIDAVLFDLGGVVIDIDFDRAFAFWAQHAGTDPALIKARYQIDEAYRRHERGELGTAGYFAHLREQLRIDLDDTIMLEGWNRIFIAPFAQIGPLFAYLSQRVVIYAFSNTNESHAAYMRAHYRELFNFFRSVFVSSEIGHRKPEARAFERVVQLIGCAPQKILFLDDLAENVAGARAVGLHAVQVTSVAQTRAALHDFGLGAKQTRARSVWLLGSAD